MCGISGAAKLSIGGLDMTNECAAGFDISGDYCVHCGASENDECGVDTNQTFEEGLKIMSLRGRIKSLEEYPDKDSKRAHALANQCQVLIAEKEETRQALFGCLSLVKLKFGNTDATANEVIRQAEAILGKP